MESTARKNRSSNIELLRILCILCIIGDHFVGQSGIRESGSLQINLFYTMVTSLSRVACSVFIIISAWFSCDREFKLKKIVHVWLTVVMYTVPITLWLYIKGIATKPDIITAFLPIGRKPLWFAGDYMVLVLISPMINMALDKFPKKLIEYYLVIMLCLQVLYTTITMELGTFSNDMWIFIFIYVLTAYIKRYYKEKIPSAKMAFSVFIILWGILIFIHAIAQSYGLIWIQTYCETFRARFQTLPNLLMAFTLFFGFYGLKIKTSKIINVIASASLGVYCFHQVPVWYTYLWQNLFFSEYHSQVLHGGVRMVYTIGAIICVWLIGTVCEIFRMKIAGLLIEDRKYCVSICNIVDNRINNAVIKNSPPQKDVKILGIIISSIVIYYIILQIFTIGF